MTPSVVHSILEATPREVALRLDAVPAGCALVEIRADLLRAGDVADLVRRARRPAIVALRTREEGGAFDGSADETRSILRAALDAGAAYADVAWDGPLRSWADGPDAGRLVLSRHGGACEPSALVTAFDAMAGTKAALLKIVPRAVRPSQSRAVREVLRHAATRGRPLACFALGAAGHASRVFALAWGAWGTYGGAAPGRETAEGQPTSRELLEVYRVLEIAPATRRFALVGAPLGHSPSPALHAQAFREAGVDAVYVPVETDLLSEVEALASGGDGLEFEGLGVTVPLKEAVAARCVRLVEAASSGAVNTVVLGAGGWEGFNTDAPAALALVRAHLDPRGARVAIAGAGGTARGIAWALAKAGARVGLFNRDRRRAERVAAGIGAEASEWQALAKASWDVLVQATPLGRNGEDVVPASALNGRLVLDAAYGPEPTPLVIAARARGLAVVDGRELLLSQGRLQFERLTGRPAPPSSFSAVSAP